ncbi:NAD(P)H-hydrate dehydratase [Vibrio vulnificus]|nr:NAD(P)H-hydrate dehydratase [Vibrio vulnificus]HAS8569508.1 NAD(P)H-hydrate dehydratase [Vibrio vulnificus]HAS8570400.1 NAD(P)H-hydrate dehydratase [Vibrio vulnificus]
MTAMDLRKALYTAKQVREGEVGAAANAGVTLYDLMERAGRATFAVILNYYPAVSRLCVVCGKGNNGGDGYVVARLALQQGLHVVLIQSGDAESLSGDAKQAQQAWRDAGGEISDTTSLNGALSDCDLVVDALLGTGLAGAVREEMAKVIDTVNLAGKPIVSVDIPSGLCADTGQALPDAIHADHTVTFIGTKQGLVTGKARAFCGLIHFADLGVGAEFSKLVPSFKMTIERDEIAQWRLTRDRCAHKGDHGRVVLLGGNRGMSGAISLAATACARSGAGLMAALTHPESALPLQIHCPEVMTLGYNEDKKELEKKLDWADVLVVGPGLGTDEWAKKRWNDIANYQGPMVLDADGLNWLARYPNHNDQRIITPHPGEAARLLGCSVNEVEADRFAAISVLQSQYGGVVVLKGAGTLICDGTQTFVCNAGNPGMATGGMGDVLSGVIGALLAQKLPLLRAASLGVLLHSCAADICAEQDGEIGLLASDLFDKIRQLLNAD